MKVGEKMVKTDDIYEEYANLIYKYLYRLSGNREISEELTQETFYQALRTADSFKGESKISTWLCQIAKHSWYKYLEKQPKEKPMCFEDIPEVADEEGSPERLIMKVDGRVALYRQVHLLNEPYKEVVMLRILGELRFSEIGLIMGKTENWARVTFHRAKMILIERGKQNGE